MHEIVDPILAFPLANFFVFGGMLLLLIAVVLHLTGKIRPDAKWRGMVGALGPVFILAGFVIYLSGKAPATPTLSKRSVCDSFAVQAVKQNEEKSRLGCEFTGPRWQGYYENYYKWCLEGSDDFAEVEFNAREAELNECAANG